MKQWTLAAEDLAGWAYRPVSMLGRIMNLRRHWAQFDLRARRRAASRQLYLIETLTLSPKKTVILFRCGGGRYLAGTGADGVTCLLKVDMEEFPSSPSAGESWG